MRAHPERVAVDLAVRLGLLALFAYFALTLVRPFIPLLLWSVILTVAFFPVFTWLRARFGGRSWLAALLLTGFGIAIVAGPTTVLLSSLIDSLEFIARHVGSGRVDLPPPPKMIVDLPMIGDELTDAWQLASSNLEGFLGQYGRPIVSVGEWTLHAVAGLAGSVVLVLAAVIISGFLYGPAPRLTAGCAASPSGWSGRGLGLRRPRRRHHPQRRARGDRGGADPGAADRLRADRRRGAGGGAADARGAGARHPAGRCGAGGDPAPDLGLGDARHHPRAVADALPDPRHARGQRAGSRC